jgi:hypothetical protein
MTSAVVLLWMKSHHQMRFVVPFAFLACSNNLQFFSGKIVELRQKFGAH